VNPENPRIVNPEFLPPQKVMKNEKSAKKTCLDARNYG
jgi:hypothetical protein